MDEEKLNEAIARAVNDFGSASGAVQQLAASLNMAAKSASGNATASSVASAALDQLRTRSDNLQKGFANTTGAIIGLAGSLTGISSAVYGAEKAFTSVVPTVDAISTLMIKMSEAVGLASSGLTVMGVSLGRAPESIAKFVGTGIALVSDMVKFQLETAQKVADSFVEVTKAGALFGSGISQFVNQANALGLPMQSFKNIVVANVESLAKLGLGQTQGAKIVAGFAKQIVDNEQYNTRLNESLVALYGSVDALAQGTAEYLALQSQLGYNAQQIFVTQKDAIADYLLRQKELTAITGKNAELARREEEGRRRQLDYNLKLSRLGDVAQKNVQEGISVAGKIFNDQGAKVAEEYFATGGKLFSQEAITFAATNAEAMAVIEQLMAGVDQNREDFRKNYANLLQNNAAALEGYARSLEDLAEVNRAANSPIIKGKTEIGSSILQNLTLIKSATDIVAEIEKNRAAAAEGAQDPATKATVEAIREMLKNQREIDKVVLTNMNSMGDMVKQLNALQLSLIQMQGQASEAFNKLLSGTFKTAADAETFLKQLNQSIVDAIRDGFVQLGGRLPEVPAKTAPPTPRSAEPAAPAAPQANAAPQTPAPQPPAQNMPKRAEGGLATGPTTVGEDGTEAVIPLKGGKIPLEVDLSQLEKPLKAQIELTERLIDEVRTSRDIQQQILNASY